MPNVSLMVPSPKHLIFSSNDHCLNYMKISCVQPYADLSHVHRWLLNGQWESNSRPCIPFPVPQDCTEDNCYTQGNVSYLLRYSLRHHQTGQFQTTVSAKLFCKVHSKATSHASEYVQKSSSVTLLCLVKEGNRTVMQLLQTTDTST